MSLVEQAIARLRNQQSGVKMPAMGGAAPKSAAPPVVNQSEDSKAANRLVIDMAALRTGGCLPEVSKERQFSDQYRRIKRPLIEKALSGDDAGGEPRVIMIASAVPGDGKTFTSINLAFSMALERDISLLLIDSDVAKHHITDIFGLRDRKGLLDALTDESLDPETLVVPTNSRGFSILPAGTRMEGTAELLSSNRMRQIVTSLCARNPRRILLLDSPPLLITNEGPALVKVAGQVVLVVRAGVTPRHAVQAAIDMFDEKQAGGLILNEVKVGLTEGYYGYGAYGAPGDGS
ncbi:MAG TPA: AAA family ATPase [Rhizomicrobium sp.]|jgi:exopolysaccharide/PEP-CTERM locus tyrosine autokinase|nr:AAA family ATPase [Rhizomicrobium sp.]